MDKVVRVTFEIPEHIRRAIGIIASREGLTLGEALTLCVEQAAPEIVTEAKVAVDDGVPSLVRKGRPPKKPKE